MKEIKDEVVRRFKAGLWQNEASYYLSDSRKMKSLLGLVMHLFGKRALWPVLRDLLLLYYYVKDIVEGRYRNYNKGKLIIVVGVLLYVVSPLDLIPDFLAFTGFLDDAALIGYTVKVLDGELDRYYKWNKAHRRSSDSEESDAKAAVAPTAGQA